MTGSLSIWRSEKENSEVVNNRGDEWAAQQPTWTSPIELDPIRPPTEMPIGRHYEMPELYDHRSEAVRN